MQAAPTKIGPGSKLWHLEVYEFYVGWYPRIIHFNRVFHYKPSILGYPYFWKHPCGSDLILLVARLFLGGRVRTAFIDTFGVLHQEVGTIDVPLTVARPISWIF